MTEKHDPEVILLEILCDKKKNAIDVGANKGAYIQLILPLCKHLYAYEPLPQMGFAQILVFAHLIKILHIYSEFCGFAQ